MRRLNIVHLTGDFPDPIDMLKTPVIESFVDLTSTSFEHTVFSINRIAPPASKLASGIMLRRPMDIATKPFAYGTAVGYEAPGRGLFHKSKLVELGDWLADRVAAMGIRPKLLVGHKLTIEGIAIQRAALRLNIPYAITIQSHTDDKILKARPDLHALFREIYHNASLVVCFTPIAREKIDAKLKRRRGTTRIIPCPTDLDARLDPQPATNGLLSVFHLKNFRNKNLSGMLDALSIANEDGANLFLELAGGGDQEDIRACEALAASHEDIQFLGPLDRNNLQKRMNKAKVFVMPSFSESFGLVFIEALFAGLPIIYASQTAIDGFFEGCDFAIPVDPYDPRAIARAMIEASLNEAALKASLANWQNSDKAERFTRKMIAEDYRRALRGACLAHR